MTYRIMQLSGLEIFRIEQLTKCWFSPCFYWKVMKFWDYGWGGDMSRFTEFDSMISAVRQVEALELRDKTRGARKRNGWKEVI